MIHQYKLGGYNIVLDVYAHSLTESVDPVEPAFNSLENILRAGYQGEGAECRKGEGDQFYK